MCGIEYFARCNWTSEEQSVCYTTCMITRLSRVAVNMNMCIPASHSNRWQNDCCLSIFLLHLLLCSLYIRSMHACMERCNAIISVCLSIILLVCFEALDLQLYQPPDNNDRKVLHSFASNTSVWLLFPPLLLVSILYNTLLLQPQ